MPPPNDVVFCVHTFDMRVAKQLRERTTKERYQIRQLRVQCQEASRKSRGKSQREKDEEELFKRLKAEEAAKAKVEMDFAARLREQERLKAERQSGSRLVMLLSKVERQVITTFI